MPDTPQPLNTNVTERQIRWELWFVTHWLLLKRIGYGALIAVAAASWLYTIWGVINHFFIEGETLRREIAQLAVQANERKPILVRQQHRPLEIAQVFLIPNGGTSFDAAARITNPNSAWVVRVSYTLDIPGAPREVGHTTILPGGDRWLTRLNATSASTPSSATFTVLEESWERVTFRTATDIPAFIHARSNVVITDAVYVPPVATASGGSSTLRVSRATFTATNESAYHLRSPEFTILLMRGGEVIAVNRVALDTLRAGERRTVAATWFNSIGLVTGVDIIPFVDVFDPQAFIAPNGTQSQ